MPMDEAGRVPTRRTTQILWGWTTAVIVVSVVGTAAAGSSDPAKLPPPTAVVPISPEGLETSGGVSSPPPSGGAQSPTALPTTPAGDGSPSPGSPPPTTTPPTPPVETPPTRDAPPQTTEPQTREPQTRAPQPRAPQTRPPRTEAPPARPAPPPSTGRRLVGPSSAAGFDDFLDTFCKGRRFRGALLINGRRTPETGRWVCTRFGPFDTIDVDDACQQSFGSQARAREQVSGDIRTLRCFDS